MRCIEIFDMYKGDSVYISINLNMRCIEIFDMYKGDSVYISINLNMRCIEISELPFLFRYRKR